MLAAHSLRLSVGVTGVHQAPLPTINRGIISEMGRGENSNNTTTGGGNGPWGLVEVMKGNWTQRSERRHPNSGFSGRFIRMKNQLMKPASCPVLVEWSWVK